MPGEPGRGMPGDPDGECTGKFEGTGARDMLGERDRCGGIPGEPDDERIGKLEGTVGRSSQGSEDCEVATL